MQEHVPFAVTTGAWWLYWAEQFLMHGMLLGSGIYASSKWLDHRNEQRQRLAFRQATRQAILEEQSDFGKAIISQTFYRKTHDGSYNQVIDPKGRASPENILGPELWLAIEEYWKKAEQDATLDLPSPLQHLHKHVPESLWSAMQEAILREWRNYFWLNFKRPNGVLPLPIMEPGANGQMKPAILWIQLRNKNFPMLPPIEKIRFRNHNADAFEGIVFEDNQEDNYEADRHKTLKAVFNSLGHPDQKTAWIRRLAVWDMSKQGTQQAADPEIA